MIPLFCWWVLANSCPLPIPTGVYDATVTAVEATDVAIGTIFEACQVSGPPAGTQAHATRRILLVLYLPHRNTATF